MKQLAIIGRILFAVPFAVIGLTHFLMRPHFLEMLNNSLFPGSLYAVILSGIMLIVASISILLNKYVKVACLWLAGMLLVIIISIHVPNLFYPEHFEYALNQLLKDSALLGASLMISFYLSTTKEVKE